MAAVPAQAAIPAAIPQNDGNPPLKDLAYKILGNSYAAYFPEGGPEPSDRQLANAALTELGEECPALAPRLHGGSRRKNRKTRKGRGNRKSRRH